MPENACHQRRAFRATLGRIGIGPRRLGPGDLVAVLFGRHCPVLLRFRDDQFEQLGETCDDVVMDGEAVERDDERDGENVVFEIC